MKIQALAFDTGGTVLDWHGGLVAALSAAGARHALEKDWHAIANGWRRRSLQGIVGQVRPAFHMDEMIGFDKPHAEAYATAAPWIGIAPENVLMVACHNFDRNAARAAGLRTTFVRRRHELGPQGPPDPKPNRAHDFVVAGFEELRTALLGGGSHAPA